jgi:hypothetical protein
MEPLSCPTVHVYALYTVADNGSQQPDRIQRTLHIEGGATSDERIQQMAQEAAQQLADAFGLPVGVWLEQRPNEVMRFLKEIMSQELIVVCQPAVPYGQW